ncbi:MAG: endonuclease IV [Ruminococcaceae bacterium]|nr:endonuclease IV [Oscillospiraceae bacterium]
MSATFGPAGNSDSFYKEKHKSTLEAPKWLREKGLDAYEYSAGNGITGSTATFEAIGKKAKENGILLSFHTPYYISLSGIDPEKRLKSLSYIKASLNAAEAMGADTIVIHAGSASKISRSEALSLASDTLMRALMDNPDTKVHFGVETMGKKNQLGTLEEIIFLCQLDPRLYPVVDFGHLNARECGLFKTWEDYAHVFEVISKKLCPEKAEFLHCHFSKIEYTSAGEKKHLTFDDAVYGPPFEPLMEAIHRLGVSPRIICESDGTMAEDALAMKQYYQSLCNT